MERHVEVVGKGFDNYRKLFMEGRGEGCSARLQESRRAALSNCCVQNRERETGQGWHRGNLSGRVRARVRAAGRRVCE